MMKKSSSDAIQVLNALYPSNFHGWLNLFGREDASEVTLEDGESCWSGIGEITLGTIEAGAVTGPGREEVGRD